MCTINTESKLSYTHRIISQYCDSKRFGTFIKILAIAALAFCLPAVAPGQNAWQFGSLPANSSVPKPDDQQVYEILLKMLDRWNAHDIEGYLGVYWNSPELLVVVGSEQFNGWQQLHDSYISGYQPVNRYGFHSTQTHPDQAAEADLALALTWWSVTFPNSKQPVVGNSTMNLQKLEDGWKIVAFISSIGGV